MFLDEARLAASVSHAHIVQVYELGREGDLDFIVMEYVEGQPLNKLLYRRPLPPDKVADWGLQVAEGLARAHRKGLIHRDLKPANDARSDIFSFGTVLYEMTTGQRPFAGSRPADIVQEILQPAPAPECRAEFEMRLLFAELPPSRCRQPGPPPTFR